MNYVGGFFNLLNPYALLGGLAGLGYSRCKVRFFWRCGRPTMCRHGPSAARKLWPVVLVVGAATVVATYFATDIFQRLGVDPGISAIGAGAAFLAGGWFMSRRRFGWAFAMNALTVALTLVTTFRGLYPFVMISSLNPAWSLTIYNASSTPYTLGDHDHHRVDHGADCLGVSGVELLRVPASGDGEGQADVLAGNEADRA